MIRLVVWLCWYWLVAGSVFSRGISGFIRTSQIISYLRLLPFSSLSSSSPPFHHLLFFLFFFFFFFCCCFSSAYQFITCLGLRRRRRDIYAWRESRDQQQITWPAADHVTSSESRDRRAICPPIGSGYWLIGEIILWWPCIISSVIIPSRAQ